MREITPAIIGITLVLTAVFIPMAFASGSVGIIYRQFSISDGDIHFTVGIPGADVNACALCNPAQTTWYSSG
ncbi:efflux RND transporter permease subunit [Klebsiella pneumoniae subsp. pneumoniae]|nr:efflux RND transporter permease subunit [Klebsiella pneumoniae subsp. pneumoniae]